MPRNDGSDGQYAEPSLRVLFRPEGDKERGSLEVGVNRLSRS